MENKSHPRTQKIKKPLAGPLESSHLKDLLKKSASPGNNLLYLEKYLLAGVETNNNIGPNRKSYLLAQKKINNDIHSLDNILTKEKKSYLRDINNEEVLGAVHDIKKLPRAILKCHHINHFNFCQIIVHEKGNLTAQSYSNNKSNSDIPASLFNKTFQTIKKSKGELFNSNLLNGEHLNLLGYFFALSLESNQFRWIVLIGNNDFFSPEERLVSDLSSEILKLSSTIESIFFLCKHDDKIEHIIKALDHIPSPIMIKDKRDAVIYQNISHEEIFENEIESYDKKSFDLDDGNELCIFTETTSKNSTDIYHHYKVNLLGELLNTLKHELSNPLFGLLLSSEIMASQTDDTESKELIGDISSRADRCQTIIKNFSKLYGDQESNETNIIELIKETMTLTKSETRGISKKLENNITEENIVAKTHATSLSQVIFNLIINASQAIQLNEEIMSGEILIKCKYINNQYEISVIDNGPGVPDHLKETIFDNFFTTKKDGTGLGLSICMNLIDKMNGQIKYSPRKDKKGSVFTIIFQ